MGAVTDILSLDYDALGAEISALGEPAYRAGQLFSWLHDKRALSFDEMSNLPSALREKLKSRFSIAVAEPIKEARSKDGTVKYLFEFADGARVETVAMSYEHGLSVCLSTQVGCRMGCAFCATGRSGFERSLEAGEILAQLYKVSELHSARADSVVLMGMGEPLDNFENVTRFCDIVCDGRGYNLSSRGITLSTCGIVPKIDELARQRRQLTLSVSLHATNDERRSALMPINRKYPLGELIPACERYFAQTGRRVTFEYAVIAGENDSHADAERLASVAKRVRAHINLIPVNPAGDDTLRATREQTVLFCERIKALGANATVRRTLGGDIDAACGQLRRRAAQEKTI